MAQSPLTDVISWKIADDWVGCCAAFGWVPARTQDGSSTLEALILDCPDPSVEIVALGFPSPSKPIACFGNTELHVRGVIECSEPIVDSAYELDSPWRSRRFCDLSERIAVYGNAATSLLDTPNYGSLYTDFVLVTGHLGDPRSSECQWTAGTYINVVPEEGGPPETAEFACRQLFVVTAIESI